MNLPTSVAERINHGGRSAILTAVALGTAIGGLYAVVDLLTPPSLPEWLLIAAYATSLIFFSAPFLQSIRSGLICGIAALITQTALEIAYYASVGPYGVWITAIVATYSVLTLDRLVVFLVAGTLGGYLGQKLK